MAPSTSFGSNIIVSKPLLVISNVAKFHMSVILLSLYCVWFYLVF